MECQDEKGRAEATHTPTFWFVIGRLSGQLEVRDLFIYRGLSRKIQ